MTPAAAILLSSALPLLGQVPAPPEPKTEWVETPAEPAKGCPAAPKLLLDDTLFIITAPARWDRHDWLQTGQGLAVVVGTALLLDTRVRDESQRLRSPGPDKVALQIQKFGTGYAFGVVGGFWVYGKLAGDS
ncbi:MAG TPA: hypothetical protein VJ549_04700, partial [Geothrix sp.]|nr:hypothetical protein [Geothrix sp.]